jgi:hypothetical protein
VLGIVCACVTQTLVRDETALMAAERVHGLPLIPANAALPPRAAPAKPPTVYALTAQ